jgi:hypothetical protein
VIASWPSSAVIESWPPANLLPNPSRSAAGFVSRRVSPASLTRLFAFLFSNPEKDRLTQAIIPCPFREFDLANHYRFHPIHLGSG